MTSDSPGEPKQEQAEALQRSEERLRLVMQATNDAIWDIDLTAKSVWWNDCYDRLFGARPSETKSAWDWWILHLHPDDRARVVASFRAAIEGSADRWTCEYRYRRANGDYAYVLDRAFLARSPNGKATRILGAMLDLTGQKESEQQLSLQGQTIRRLFELQEQERKLVSQDIHDGLAQMLTGACMRLESVRGRVRGKHAIELEVSCELLRSAIAETRRLVNDLRPLIIDESGLEESIRHLIADLTRHTTCELSLECRLDRESREPVLNGVVYRIVQEAVGNSLRHGQAAHVAIKLQREASDLIITVQDDGVGFDPQGVSPDRFGLRGIQERARLFGGEAVIVSQPGAGANLRVRLCVPGWDAAP